jgi:hypothetical protein
MVLHGVPDYGLATGWSGTVHVVEGELDSVPPLVQASAQKARSGQSNTALNESFAVQWQVPCAAAAFAPAVQLQQVPWHYCCSVVNLDYEPTLCTNSIRFISCQSKPYVLCCMLIDAGASVPCPAGLCAA